MAGTSSRSSRRRSGRGGGLMNEINVVPYIDVMLVLLVIFMVTAPLVPTGTVDVPRLGVANQKPDQYIALELKSAQTISLLPSNMQTKEQRDLPRAQALRELLALRTRFPQAPVVISADKAIRYEVVINLMDELQKAGVKDVKLSVKTGS
jgi:biopolymer transport protein TolR